MLAPPRQPPLAAASQRDAATTVELQAPSPYGDGELSSELSEPPESEASDEDGAGSDGKDEENSGAAGLDAGPARRVDPVWYSEIADTFLRALNLVPNLGGTRVRLNGGLFRRTELLVEYVRRQTGQIRSPQQAQNRIDIQRWRNKDDASYQDLLSGRSATAQELAATDWDTLLGPDLFPHVKAPPSTRHVKKRRIFKVDRPPKKKPRRARPDSPGSEQPRRSRRRRTTTSSSERSRSTTPDDMIDTAPPPRPASTRPRPPPPTPAPPLAVPLPQAAQLRTTDQAPQLFLHDLTAFFSSLHPTHNHEPSARALLELGVDSTSALVLLLGLEQSSLKLLYQHLRRTGRLGPLDVAWLKKADDSDDDEKPGKGSLWDHELDAVLCKALALLPAMGRRVVYLETNGESYGRNGLVGEYIRRQTGKYRSRIQVASHLVVLLRHNADNARIKNLIVGHKVSPDALAAIKWSTLLGPDLFPETCSSAKAANDKVKRLQLAAEAERKAARAASGLPSTTRRKRKRERERSRARARGGAHGAARRGQQKHEIAADEHRGSSSLRKKARRMLEPPPLAFPPFPSTSSTSVTSAHSTLPPFLAALNPALVPLAPHLAAAGLDSVDALAKLVLLEPAMLALVLDEVRLRAPAESPVSVVQLRLLGRRLEEARRALRAGG
ncbi:hypothetical protein JCM9279_007502 [Rhodotorula babjevae]